MGGNYFPSPFFESWVNTQSNFDSFRLYLCSTTYSLHTGTYTKFANLSFATYIILIKVFKCECYIKKFCNKTDLPTSVLF
jgi:hypothetical protein